MDIFSSLKTSAVLDCFKDNNMEFVCVPANMTHLLQLLDLTVIVYVKKFTNRKFSEWYSSQIMKQLDDGKELHVIDLDLKLSKLKPLHAQKKVRKLSTVRGKQ